MYTHAAERVISAIQNVETTNYLVDNYCLCHNQEYLNKNSWTCDIGYPKCGGKKYIAIWPSVCMHIKGFDSKDLFSRGGGHSQG